MQRLALPVRQLLGLQGLQRLVLQGHPLPAPQVTLQLVQLARLLLVLQAPQLPVLLVRL